MPTYDYECDACGHTWELFQSITADPVTKCPECGKKKARRLFGTGAALMFKGSGFYETDYRSDSYQKSKQADEKSSDGSGASSESKSDSSSTSPEKSTAAESKPASSSSSESSSSQRSEQSTSSKASRTARKPPSGTPAKKGKKKS